ncbi:MAG: methyltransferase, TIGR04325 family [Candidatus Edwardsbacteria bacterium]|nr:methyltransferase, TIGR04325 family [Candidatus Edwardsbacteria bacterium]
MLLRRIWRRLTGKGHARPTYSEYASYQEALSDSDGYQQAELLNLVREKTRIYRGSLARDPSRTIDNPQLTQNLLVFASLGNTGPIQVLELGGACGAAFFEMDTFFPGIIKRWAIVETPAMVATGSASFQSDRLVFSSDLAGALKQGTQPDMVLAQGVLQYLKDPLKTLGDLAALGVRHLYFCRIMASPDIQSPLFTRQEANLSAHGPGPMPEGFTDRVTTQPLTIVPASAFDAIPAAGYNIVYSFREGPDFIWRLPGREIAVRHVGYLYRKSE